MRVLLLLSVAAGSVWASTCTEANVCQRIAGREPLFVGEVIQGGKTTEIEDLPSAGKIRFRVIEAFRGVAVAKTIEIPVWDRSYFELGRRYLLTSLDEGRVLDGCIGARPVERYADEVRQFRDYFAGRMARQIQGYVVATNQFPELARAYLYTGDAFPLEGVEVSALNRGHVYRTRTDKYGYYAIRVPNPGIYIVESKLRHYTPDRPKRVHIAGDGCAVQDLGLFTNSVVSGHVREESGSPVKDARVQLISLESPSAQTSGPNPILLNTHSDANGSFTLEHVPVGQYILRLVDADTYYPGASSIGDAWVIEVKSGKEHVRGKDLVRISGRK